MAKENSLRDICTICLTNFAMDEEQQRLICHHSFHAECIDKWLLHKNNCPTCRQVVVIGCSEAPVETPHEANSHRINVRHYDPEYATAIMGGNYSMPHLITVNLIAFRYETKENGTIITPLKKFLYILGRNAIFFHLGRNSSQCFGRRVNFSVLTFVITVLFLISFLFLFNFYWDGHLLQKHHG